MGKALDGRPRPQKQLSQPTLGATENMEAGRLRVSQSSEGSELIQSTSVTTSSPNSATVNSDTSRDTDMGKQLNDFIEHIKRWSGMVCKLLLVSQVGCRPQAPADWVMAYSLTLWMGWHTLLHTTTFIAWTNCKRMKEKATGKLQWEGSFTSLHDIIYFKHQNVLFYRAHEGTPKSIRRWG